MDWFCEGLKSAIRTSIACARQFAAMLLCMMSTEVLLDDLLNEVEGAMMKTDQTTSSLDNKG